MNLTRQTNPVAKIYQPVPCGSAAGIIASMGPDAAAVAPELVADGVGCSSGRSRQDRVCPVGEFALRGGDVPVAGIAGG